MRVFVTPVLSILLIGMSSASMRAADQRDLDSCGNAKNASLAIQACNRILSDTGQTAYVRAEAFFRRGKIYFANDDADHAIADFSAVIRLDAKNSMAFNNRGIAYKMKGDPKRALADYNEAVRLDPTNAVALRNRGALYVAMDDNRAMADLNEAIRLDPKDAANALLWRGVIYARMGKADSADADWDEAMRLDPGKANSFFKVMQKLLQ